MIKLLNLSDLHAHPYRQFSNGGSRLRNTIRIIRHAFDIAFQQGCAAILFEGDWFHEQGKIDTHALNESIRFLNQCEELYPDLILYAISGNHDHKGKNLMDTPSPSALTALENACSNFRVLDYGTVRIGMSNVMVHGIPYMEFPTDFYLTLDAMKAFVEGNPDHVHILMMHQVPSGGADPIPAQVDSHHELFEKYDYILNGHVHRRQQITPKFLTVGSPLHHDLGDIGQDKGLIMLTIEDNGKITNEFIPLDYPQFRRVPYGTPVPKEWENDYVVMDPPPAEVNALADMSKFTSTQSPAQIIQAYGEHHQLDQSLINIGLNAL